ncbi:NADH-ubiquinone oxidoreductase 75 kDa subunit, mitochondrial [Hondaea fermentalgiana]|uniref:NADH-ubiquinone oxidoreductase 75 kDa subunit, mitochondrial n=1 Tax=Hondaea fermentalgiana TaxID=2315210 RepID=A0A2R5GF70_9STRA|nr:NADH-ubiquinone oxidoreductase 75 kDa subunit, mitochondrial [Hondaea fermentalgiana]|eukprot:GBG26484.1 NADH-ubiquinone oxidoreductase 75 kDa subunit, mitochondrial [Hondaea fermentalgiana]
MMGALTSKPYSFTARPWELKDTDTVDVMDGMGASIKLQTKGGEVMRVVPRENDAINEEWINDKTRFAYDGLKRQRLTRPLVRSVEKPGSWDSTGSNWRGAFARIKTALEKQRAKGGSVRAVCGPSTDLYSALALSDFANQYADVELESLGSTGGSLGADITSQYRFNSTILGIETADVVLLVGTPLAAESPLLQTRLRKMFLHGEMDVYSIGMPSDLTFPIAQAGLTPATLVDIAEGRHPLCAKLAEAERPAIVVSSQIYKRQDGEALKGVIETIAAKSGNFRQYDKETGELVWNGVNTLHHNANDVGLLDLGRCQPFDDSADREAADVLYLLNVTAADLPVPIDQLIGPNTFVVFQGHHGDELASRADVVLAGAAFSEKNGVYVNFEGRAQLARNAIVPPVDARVDWKIVRAMSEACADLPLAYDTEEEIHERLASLVPTLECRGKVSPSILPEQLLGADYAKIAASTPGDVDCTPFRPAIHDFHLDGHIIARSSQTMAKASQELGDHSNFLPIAQ